MPDRAQTTIRDGLDVLTSRTFAAGGITEITLLKTSKRTVRGYFDKAETAQVALAELPRALKPEGVYVALNPLSPDLLARAVNRFEMFAETRAGNADVQRRLWLPIDADPVRARGISATDTEVAASVARVDALVAWLQAEHGWPAPVRACGGNSGHALYAIDEPNDAATEALTKRIYAVLAARFSNDTVTIDATVANAARIWTLYGTLKRKGDSTTDRPHRRSWIGERPSPLIVVSRAQLEAVAAVAEPERPRRPTTTVRSGSRPILDMRSEFEHRGWYLRELSGGKHAVRCPWADEHSGESGPSETVLFDPPVPGEVWGFRCQHAHCVGRSIKDVWERLRPTPSNIREFRPREGHVEPPAPEMPSTFTATDGRYTFAALDAMIEFTIDHLRRERFNLVGELETRCYLPGARVYGDRGTLLISTLNCSSARARQDLARLLSARAQTKDQVDWVGLLEDFTQRILAAERTGEPSAWLHEIPRPTRDSTIHVFGLPVLLHHPQILFAPGGATKSLLSLAILGELGQRGIRTLVLDWEMDGGEQRIRADALQLPPTIRYRRCDQPLVVLADSIRRDVIEHEVEFILLDSIAPACHVRPEESEAAIDFFKGWRRIGKGGLAIAHTRAEDGEHRPFGSVFWHNLARSTWFVKRVGEVGSPVTLGIFHRKVNHGALRPPFGLELHLETDPQNPDILTRVSVRRTEITEIPELASTLPLWQRMGSALTRGARTIAELAQELDAKPDSIEKALKRDKGRRFALITKTVLGRFECTV